ncbi:hypothetical protein BGZ60DRAFT_474173 [Tricladium varicosporioides]|nr:hypothetical protein BGZ60DRAFT_474173 [Hymenoscyphus varicosporioides]
MPLTKRISQAHPDFTTKLSKMALPLRPLVRINHGDPHPLFPQTYLHFWLLTSSQLDDFASFYHQRTPCEFSSWYPCPVFESWDKNAGVEEKRRRIGRFIGLRGCESPVSERMIQDEARRARWREEEEELMFRRKFGGC